MKRYPLTIIIILTSLLVSIPGIIIGIRDRSFAYPAAAVAIHAVKDGQLIKPDYERIIEEARKEAGVAGGEGSGAGDEQDGDGASKAAGETGSKEKDPDEVEVVKAPGSDEESHDKEEASHETSEDEEDEPEEREDEGSSDDEEPEEEEDEGGFVTVGDEYFLDACYIGDSRVQGLGLYSDLPGYNMGTVGMQLYKVFDRRAITIDGAKFTIPEVLSAGPQYGKIYLGFGLNELGWGNAEMFAEYYYYFIDYLKAVQPDAVIYVMSIIHVTESEQQKSTLFRNETINARNEVLREIAENEHVYFLDLNEVFTDEYGNLAEEDSFDGIHIKKGAITKWADYLRTHAIVKQGVSDEEEHDED